MKVPGFVSLSFIYLPPFYLFIRRFYLNIIPFLIFFGVLAGMKMKFLKIIELHAILRKCPRLPAQGLNPMFGFMETIYK